MKFPNFSLPTLCIAKNYKNLLFTLFLTLISLAGFSQQLAFPTAKGAGAYATGGRGGQVIHVTNLDASGPGSFLEALNTPGTRTIVFDVGGVIDMRESTGYFVAMMSGHEYDNVTIAGQTAPGGITIEGYSFQISDVNNIIMRYIRDKHVSIQGRQEDAAYLRGNVDMILDHCSFLNGKDETISPYDTNITDHTDITMQHSLIGNGKTGAIFGDYEAGDQDKPAGNYSILNNLWVDISHRFPNTSPYADGNYDVINNVVYNAKLRFISLSGSNDTEDRYGNPVDWSNNDVNVNNIGNYYYTSAKFLDSYGAGYAAVNSNQIQEWSLNPTNVDIYTANNVVKGVFDQSNGFPKVNDWEQWTNFNTGSNDWVPLQTEDWFTTTQNPLVGKPFTITSAADAYTNVMADVGANAYLNDDHQKVNYTDAQDDYLIQKTINDSATHLGGWYSEDAIYGPDTHSSTVFTRPANWDTDGDGMPNTWETANGFDPNVADNNGDADGDGYTNLEEYLNLIDGDVVEIDVTGVTVTPSTATVNIPDTITLTSVFEPADASNQSGVWSSSDETVATVNASGVVTPVSVGEVVITFNSNEGGFSDSATITVTNIPIDVESVSLTPETLDLNINVTGTLVATVLPANAWDQTGVWTSSNPAVATVNDQGLIQPIAVGETIITFTTNDGGFSDTSTVTVNDDSFGSYEFYNADTDNLIQVVEGGEMFDLDQIGDRVNFRAIPFGGDSNPEVESVGIEWNGIETGDYSENAPLYSGMTGHVGNDYQAYTVSEGAYNFAVTYYSENGQTGDIVAVDYFTLNFMRGTQSNQVSVSDDSTICLGDTAALIASGANSYLWSTGETSETIAVTPDTTTTYTVTGTHSDGSTTEASVTVTVNDSPIVDAGADQTICAGESVVLTATTTGGTITWSNGATTASITVTPSDTTTYTATVSNNGCFSTDEVTVNVVALPNADAGNDVTVVNGDSATLTASGGGDYLWSTGETTDSIVVSPTTDTTYSVTVTNGSGCTDEDSVNVTVVDAIVADAGDDVSICSGESTTLTASGGDNYQWSTGQTTQSITVNPTTTTTYTVTVSNQSTSDTDSVTVTVFDAPTADAGNDVTIVSGQNTVLSASGGDTYEWSTGETTESITVSPTTDTTYTVIAYNANGGCSDNDSVTVSVVAPVDANAGEDIAMCEGETIQLTATGGDTYEWSTGETTQTISVSPENTTNYTVTVSDDFTSDTDSVLVTVNPVPIVSAGDDVTINLGDNVTLYATGGNSYLWSTGDTNANISVSPTETTTYSVTTTINGCSDTDEVTVTVINLVQASAGDDQSICIGEEVILTANGGDTYEWSTGETTQSITVSPDSNTIYTVTVTNQNGSDSDDVMVQISDCPALNFEFKTYPNPTNGNLNLKFSGLQNTGYVTVVDILGNVLKNFTVAPNSGQVVRERVNLTAMSPGVYLVHLVTDNRKVTRKIVLR